MYHALRQTVPGGVRISPEISPATVVPLIRCLCQNSGVGYRSESCPFGAENDEKSDLLTYPKITTSIDSI